MGTRLLAIATALMIAVGYQADDLTDIASRAVEYTLGPDRGNTRRIFKVEVQVAGVFDSARSAAVARAFGVTAVRQSEVFRCDEAVQPPCRLVGTSLFLQVRLPSPNPGARTEVHVTALQQLSFGGVCRGVHDLTQTFEMVKSKDGWVVSKPLTAGEC